MAKTIRVATAQTKSLSTVQETLQSLESIAKDAQRQGVGLLLFPEAYLGGYPRTCTFGSSIGNRDDHGREQFQKYFDGAVDLGDTTEGAGTAWHERLLAIPKGAEHRGDGTREQLERVAKKTGVFLAVGLIEKAGSSLYCGMVFVSPEDGMLPEKRRKVMPTGTERLVWSQGDTSTLRAFSASIQGVNVTIGAAICWENFMPLLRFSLYAQNVNIYLAPTADGRDTWLPLLQTIASEGRAFVLSCNQVVRQSDLPSWVRPSGAVNTKALDKRPLSQSSMSSNTLTRSQSIVSQTSEGHEICWPNSDATSGHQEEHGPEGITDSPGLRNANEHSPTPRRRLSSIINTNEGHEICFAIPDAPSNAGNSSTRSQPATFSKATRDIAVNGKNFEGSEDMLVSRGGSCIVSPFGAVIKEPLWMVEGLSIADIDVEDCIKGKYDFDVAGHYSRSDAFKLNVRGLELQPP